MSKDIEDMLNDLLKELGMSRKTRSINDAPEEPICTANSDTDLDCPSIYMKNWAIDQDTYYAIGDTCKTLPTGLYEPGFSEGIGHTLSTLVNDVDEILDLPDSESEKVLEEIREFTTKKEIFKQLGFLYKRGILLWGPPGSGKTVTVQQLIRMFTKEMGGIAVMCGHPRLLTGALGDFRRLEPDRQVLVIMEDLDALIDRYNESDFLNILDGESQLQNVVYVATTNYPELLDDRFKDRPSRFDTVRRIGMPTKEARRVYLKAKLKHFKDSEIEEFVEGTGDYSIAYVKELIVLTQCLGYSLEDALKRLDHMRNVSPDSTTENKGSFGFAS